MFYQPVPNSQQSLELPVLNADAPLQGMQAWQAWQLGGHRALSLRSSQAGALHVLRGRLWATQTLAHAPGGWKCLDLASRDSGDVVLQAGETLQVAARQKVVVEALGVRAGEAVLFQWEPLLECQNQKSA